MIIRGDTSQEPGRQAGLKRGSPKSQGAWVTVNLSHPPK